MYIKQILKNPGIAANIPISAQFIITETPKRKPLIKPLKKLTDYNSEQRKKVEYWLAFCAIATSMLDISTKALKNFDFFHNRDAIFDLVEAFKQLRKHFSGNENFDKTENEMNDFLFTFLTMTEEQQNRVMKFQESILK